MARKYQTSTRNKIFNGYETTINDKKFYAGVTSLSVPDVKNVTSKRYSNLKLLETTDYVKTKGSVIIDDAWKNMAMVDIGYINKDPIEKQIRIDYRNSDEISAEVDYYIFGEPHKSVLDNRQAYSDCGIDSVLNCLVMGGKLEIKDQNKTETQFLKNFWDLGIAEDYENIGVLDFSDGGTIPPNYSEIFKYYGIDSECYFPEEEAGNQYSDINEFAYNISKGRCAIVGVCSKLLWGIGDTTTKEIDHAISVTGVLYDTATPDETTEPIGFFIHDTAVWMTRFITLSDFKKVTLFDEVGVQNPERGTYNKDLVGKTDIGIFVTLTTEPVKTALNNTNATGDNNDNIIIGNSGNNIIKGLGGKDVLYGGAGDDTLYGGGGNDIIFANGGRTVDINGNSTDMHTYDIPPEDEEDLSGKNFLYGENGNDYIFGGEQTDYISGGAGNDFLYGYGGRDAIYGGKGNDYISGGAGNDRLLGDAGNDVIYGGDGDDTIDGGVGNDLIYGGNGADRIETGKGNDTVFIDSKLHGVDTLSSSAGTTLLKYTQESGIKADEIIFDIAPSDTKLNMFNLKIKYDEIGKDGIVFWDFFNSKKNSNKKIVLEDSDGETFRISASSKTNAKIADSKGNNVLLSTSLKDTKISTGLHDDYVYMTKSADDRNLKDVERVDTITYTGGKDIYYSLAGDTNYVVSSFDENTNLKIYDNIEPVEKQVLDSVTSEYVTKEFVSENDSLKINADISKISFFFDVEKVSEQFSPDVYYIVSDNTELYVLNNDVITQDKSVYKSISGGDDCDGFICVDSFFKSESDFFEDDYYGNGRIEHLYTKETIGNKSVYTEYAEFNDRIAQISENVSGWLSLRGYTSAFEALQDEQISEASLNSLIACYTGDV